MSGLTYVKGVRTRFYNTLKWEVDKGADLVATDSEGLSLIEVKSVCQKVSECMGKIKLYNEKLSNQSDKLAQAIEDTDDDLIQSILREDSEISEAAMSMYYTLQSFEGTLKETVSKKDVEEKDALNKSTFSEEMHEVFEYQLKLQRDFIESQKMKDRHSSSVKLPKLDINSFSGNKLYWVEFWDSFESAIHKNDKLSGVEKFNYLRSKLTGEARTAVSGLSLTNENYKIAIDILKERFGDSQEMIDLHYKQIMDLPPAKNTMGSLRFFWDKVEKHLRSLQVLHQDTEQEIFVSMIKRKLPPDVILQLEILKGAGQKWSVNRLRNLLNQFITAKEASEKEVSMDKSEKPNGYYRNSPRDSSFISRKGGAQGTSKGYSYNGGASSGALLTNENQKSQTGTKGFKCRYCDKAHWSDECGVYKTVEERKRRIKGSCYKCLKEGHISRECKSSRSCVYCGEVNVHHRSLCGKKFGNVKAKESVQFCEEIQEGSVQIEANADGTGLLSSDEYVMMQTATTEVKSVDKDEGEKVRLLLDSGSHRTYVTADLAKRLGLKEESEQEIHMVTFGSKKTQSIKTKTTTLQIKLQNGQFTTLVANIVPDITGTIHRKSLNVVSTKRISDLTKNLFLADTIPKTHQTHKLDLLVGNDYYLDLVQSEKIEVQPGLYLLSSQLGWILSGRTQCGDNSGSHDNDVNMLVLTYGTSSTEPNIFAHVDDTIPKKPSLTDFWNMEAIGITDRVDDSEDEEAMRNFKETVKRVDGRYEVTWPWKDECPELPENRSLAIGRLRSLCGRLQKQPELFQKYDSVIKDQLEKGVIEKVETFRSDGRKYYIPHHVVITPDKSTTKLRIVYDASAKTRKEHKSLNECLYRGPVLLRNLSGILMRFRFHKIGIVSDIEKAFLQVGLQSSEQDVTRFLWLKDCENSGIKEENIQEYRFCRVPFGVISSPFLLGASIEHHLDGYNSELTNQLKNNIYMDNLITGKNTVEEANTFYRNAKEIFNDAKMNLREWITNDRKVNEAIPVKDKGSETTVKVLGHTWNTMEDTLGVSKPKSSGKIERLTKRNVLSQVASVFDPLGLISPVTLRGKALIQKVWTQNLDWDDLLSEENSSEWIEIKNDLGKLELFKLKRCIVSGNTEAEYSLLCFSDASKKAYAATVYLVQKTGNTVKCDLIFAKSRLAPVKELTIPKLELMAVVIGVRCLKFVQQETDLSIKDTYLMTDSLCVLQWIQSEKNLPVFVKNRVKEIKSYEAVNFRFVNTNFNPADIASRGCDLETLCEDKMWWHGPTCLSELMEGKESVYKINCTGTELKEEKDYSSEIEMRVEPICDSAKDTAVRLCEETMCMEHEDDCSPFGIDSGKYSSATKLLRVTAWCLRFISKLKGKRDHQNYISGKELETAETMWIKTCQYRYFKDVHASIINKRPNNLAKQLGIFVDENGLLRCMGRLGNAEISESAKHPILLPKQDRYTHLLVDDIHRKILHSGVSQTLNEIRMVYWIPHGRAVIKSRLRSCKICKRVEGGPYKLPDMPPLPKSRVTNSMPFARVGVDYMGPLYVKENTMTSKVWICLFTCLVTRAVHLELVQDMTTQSFILCLRRFIAVRGTPSLIISDNAKHFRLASETIPKIWTDIIQSHDVQDYVSNERITWMFNVELSPWMGGFYERLVGIVKRSLRKVIGRRLLMLDQMQTVLKEVESVVNRRPLVYVGDDLNSSIVITPGHFLCLNPFTGIPDTENDDEEDPEYKPLESSAEKLLKIWKKGEKLLNSFWKIWQGEYLLSLRERTQNKIKSKRIQAAEAPNVGDVVIIKEELPRGQWKLGRLIRLRVSRDGEIRSAEVVTSSGTILNRPLNLLYPIETSSDLSEHQKQEERKIVQTDELSDKRPRRKAAVIARKLVKSMI